MAFTPQSGLGAARPMQTPQARDLKLCRVTSIKDFETTHRIEVLTKDGTAPNPALVIQPGTKCPFAQGDHVVIGFIDSVKDNPVVLGAVAGWGPNLGLQDFMTWDAVAHKLTLKHTNQPNGVAVVWTPENVTVQHTSGATITFDAAGNILLTAAPGMKVKGNFEGTFKGPLDGNATTATYATTAGSIG